MNKKIREKPDDRFYNVMMQLTAIGNNLNQIAHKANYLNEIDKDKYNDEAIKWRELSDQIKREYFTDIVMVEKLKYLVWKTGGVVVGGI